MYAIQILHARLNAAARTGRPGSLFQNRWDPALFEINVNDQIIGCCSVSNLDEHTIQLGLLGFLSVENLESYFPLALGDILEYARLRGNTCVVVESGPSKIGPLLKKSGFRRIYYDDVLFSDLLAGDNTPSREERNGIIVQEARFSELPNIYTVHMSAFSSNPLKDGYAIPKRERLEMNIPRAIAARLLHVALVRLNAALRKRSVVPLFQRKWDPLPLKIEVDGTIVGYSFLLRLTPVVVELGIIGILGHARGLGIGSAAVHVIKEYARSMGAHRLITGSGPRGTGPFFQKCGFTHAFSEEVLCRT
jgi:GNAT superfamily N-acetyltransferase